MLGVTSFYDFRTFEVSTVLDVRFRVGQWGCRRCGPVITTIHRNVSRYCIVSIFFMVYGTSQDVYNGPPFKKVVKVTLMTPEQQLLFPSVIPVGRIEPCTVSVIPDSDGIHFNMLCDKGVDRTV